MEILIDYLIVMTLTILVAAFGMVLFIPIIYFVLFIFCHFKERDDDT